MDVLKTNRINWTKIIVCCIAARFQNTLVIKRYKNSNRRVRYIKLLQDYSIENPYIYKKFKLCQFTQTKEQKQWNAAIY